MKQQRSLASFNDILVPRREEFSNFMWVSRKLNSAVAYKRDKKPTPQSLKQDVLDSIRMQEIIENVCFDGDVSKSEMVHQIKLILDEIGFKKQLKVIRWLGYVLAKICTRVCSGIYVNEEGINRLKSQMGNCPIIFAPTHRSYADFILMSYLLFTYDIEVPSIAAGMDFHGMIGMGTVLRNTGAFFMRRSYNDDKVYWDTFKTYVHHLITRGELPIEFFIEGTRSRSCKSLVPKFGLLSMMMKPFFTGEVPDILIVPINISYDRVLEEKLFAFELLGIPKPKESTSAFFKSLSLVKEKYGNIYVDFTEPISCKAYFGDKLNRTQHALKPIHQQELGPSEKRLISSIAYDVVHTQQNNTVITAFNLISTLLSNNIILRNSPYSKSELIEDMKWLQNAMEHFRALVSSDYETLEETFVVHKNFVEVGFDGKVNLIHDGIDLSNVNPMKMKGHSLSNETMTNVIPMMMLQLYINPCLHYLVNSSIVTVILKSLPMNGVTKDDLYGHFRFLRSLFAHEFVFHEKWETMDFEESLEQLSRLNVIETSNGSVILGSNDKLQLLLSNMLLPFFSSYHTVCHFLTNGQFVDEFVDQGDILKNVQRMLESIIMQSKAFVHPYCLNLDTLGICLQNLSAMRVLEQHRKNGKIKYKLNIRDLNFICEKIGFYSGIYKVPVFAAENVLLSSKL